MKRSILTAAARVTIWYVVLGGLWVLLTDQVLVRVTDSEALLEWLDVAKGWILVLVTALLIYAERKRADLKAGSLAAVVAATEDAIIGATEEGIINEWNRAATNLFERPRASAVGRRIAEVLFPQEPAQNHEVIERVCRGETIRHHEIELARGDGSRNCVSLALSPIRDARGRTVGLSATARDVTDRKRAEAELRMAEFGKVARGLVHEVRNPLNAMRMQIAVIRAKLNRPDADSLALAATQLSRLEEEVMRVTVLANDFLAFGRPSPDQIEEFNARGVVEEVVGFLRPELEQSRITVRCDTAEEAPPLLVRMTREKLRRAILNLAENARQAMTEGGELEIACETVSARMVSIVVSDNGPGIPATDLPRLFEPFFSTKHGGTGLGLPIVKRTIESAGGSLHVSSEVGKGARFEVVLPLSVGAPGSDTEAHE